MDVIYLLIHLFICLLIYLFYFNYLSIVYIHINTVYDVENLVLQYTVPMTRPFSRFLRQGPISNLLNVHKGYNYLGQVAPPQKLFANTN